MKSRWFGLVLVFAIVASVACSWGQYDGVYDGSDGGLGQSCDGNQNSNIACGDGLACFNGVCSTVCSSDDACPSGQRCLSQTTGATCGSSPCVSGACVTATQATCDCPGQTCGTCNGNGLAESCAFDNECRLTCNIGLTTNNGCLAGQTCVVDNPRLDCQPCPVCCGNNCASCTSGCNQPNQNCPTTCGTQDNNGPCIAHCFGDPQHDKLFDAGAD